MNLAFLMITFGRLGYSAPAVELKYTAMYNNQAVTVVSVQGDWSCEDSEKMINCGYGTEETFILDSENKPLKSCEKFYEMTKSKDTICGLKLKNIVKISK